MNALTVEDIRKIYRGAGAEPVRAVDGVSFEVSKGQIYGLLGPNGAGKTTLVKILTTLTSPSSGRATIYGFDVVRQGLDVRRHIVAVLQQTAVDGLLTVEDNLRIYAYLHGVGANETRTRMTAVMEEFELGSQAQETVQHLSLGTKRRIQVAKIFMVDSPVIFLDESTTGMDPLMRRRATHVVSSSAGLYRPWPLEALGPRSCSPFSSYQVLNLAMVGERSGHSGKERTSCNLVRRISG